MRIRKDLIALKLVLCNEGNYERLCPFCGMFDGRTGREAKQTHVSNPTRHDPGSMINSAYLWVCGHEECGARWWHHYDVTRLTAATLHPLIAVRRAA